MLRYLIVGFLVTAGLIGGQLYLQQPESPQVTALSNPLASEPERSVTRATEDSQSASTVAENQSTPAHQESTMDPGMSTDAASIESKSSAWRENEPAAATPARYINKGLDARPLLIDKQEIANLAIGDRVQLPVPQTGQEYEMSVEEVGRHQNGDKSLKGHLVKNPDYTVVMTEGRSATFATINTPDGSFVLEAAGPQGWMLSMNDLDAMVDPNLVDYQIPEISRR